MMSLKGYIKYKKPAFGKKSLGRLMLASYLINYELRNDTNEDNWIQVDLQLREKAFRKIIVTSANILKIC